MLQSYAKSRLDVLQPALNVQVARCKRLHRATVCHRLLLLIPLAVRVAATIYPIDVAAEELVDALTLILTL